MYSYLVHERQEAMIAKTMSLSDVRQSLPTVVDEVVETKRPVVITRRGEPVAQLTPYIEVKSKSSVYPLRDVLIDIADDFDDELPMQWNALA